ncbi:MAG TPA: peptidylprolyl isomerase [Candidatus Krumholzibacteria bacterium]|nr:peptidylprolyl isomerase [Candidatus Krumholzibacteria bacterium]
MRRRRARHGAGAAGVLVALALAQAGCSGKGDTQGGRGTTQRSADALAQVNGAELRAEDLRKLIPADYRESVTGAEIYAILDRWIETELLYQHALKEHIESDTEVGETLHQMRRQILADEYLQREMKNRVRVGEDEVRDYYESHVDQYTQEVHLRHIVVNSSEEARQVLTELRAGGDFRALAQRYSVDPSGPRGGDLGFLGKGAMNPAFEPEVFQMAPGEVRGPIASGFGFHIVQVVGRRPATDPLPFELARDEIMQMLLLEKQRAAEKKLFAELRQEASIFLAKAYAGMPIEPETAPTTASTVLDTTDVSNPDMPLEDTSTTAPSEPVQPH